MMKLKLKLLTTTTLFFGAFCIQNAKAGVDFNTYTPTIIPSPYLLTFQTTDEANAKFVSYTVGADNKTTPVYYDYYVNTSAGPWEPRNINETIQTDVPMKTQNVKNTKGMKGGAFIVENSNIEGFTGAFVGNYAYGSIAITTSSIIGGAIYNDRSSIALIEGDFIDNYAGNANETDKSSRHAFGGAIYNEASTSTGAVSTGAVIDAITGNFIGNHTESGSGKVYGGAIYNKNNVSETDGELAAITSITGDFVGNYVTSNSGFASGGAIYNESGKSGASIDKITGNFIGNYASSATVAVAGGAIYNKDSDDSAARIDSITGDFVGNYAKGGGFVQGGAIYNTGTLTIEKSNFINNFVESIDSNSRDNGLEGGAIHNTGVITINEAQFIGNFIKKETAPKGGTAFGGAVYNGDKGEMTINNAQFIGNSFTGTNFSGQGGALYNAFGAILEITGNVAFMTESDTVRNRGTITLESGANLVTHALFDISAADSTEIPTVTIESGASFTNYSTVETNGNYSFNLSGGTYAFGVTATQTDTTAQAGGSVEGTITLTADSFINPIIAVGVEDGTYEYADEVNTTNGNVTLSNTLKYDTSVFNNSLYDISFEENGDSTFNYNTIKIAKKADVVGDLINAGASKNQAVAANAITQSSSNGKNKAFDDVSSEISTLLQSSNNADKQKGLALADKVSSDASAAVQSVATDTTNKLANIVSGQFVAGKMQGRSSGDAFKEVDVWAKVIANKTQFDGENAFDTNSYGVAFGMDKMATDEIKVGAGYAYTKTDIDTDSRSSDVETHSALLYSEYSLSDWYVNGVASYSWSDYNESAGIKTADYTVDTFALQAMAGKKIEKNGFLINPEAGLRYLNIQQSSYVDTLGSSVSASNSDISTAVVGASLTKEFMLENNILLRPETKLSATYDLINDDVSSIISLANGSSYTVAGKALDRFGVEFGLGVTAELTKEVELFVSYQGRFRDDYVDNSALLNVKYSF